MATIVEKLERLNACDESLNWIKRLPCDITEQEVWDRCTNINWMAWFLNTCSDVAGFDSAENRRYIQVFYELSEEVIGLMPNNVARWFEVAYKWSFYYASTESFQEAEMNIRYVKRVMSIANVPYSENPRIRASYFATSAASNIVLGSDADAHHLCLAKVLKEWSQPIGREWILNAPYIASYEKESERLCGLLRKRIPVPQPIPSPW